MLCNGMGYDDVVGGIPMILRGVETQAGTGMHRVGRKVQRLNVIFALNGLQQFFCRVPKT